MRHRGLFIQHFHTMYRSPVTQHLSLLTKKPKWPPSIGRLISCKITTVSPATKKKLSSQYRDSSGEPTGVLPREHFPPVSTIDRFHPLSSSTQKHHSPDFTRKNEKNLSNCPDKCLKLDSNVAPENAVPTKPPSTIKSFIGCPSPTPSKGGYPEVSCSLQSWLETWSREDCNMPGGHSLHKDTFNSTQPSPLSKHIAGNHPPSSILADTKPPETNFSPISASTPHPAIHQFQEDTLIEWTKSLNGNLPYTTKINECCSVKKLSIPVIRRFLSTKKSEKSGEFGESRCVVEFAKGPVRFCPRVDEKKIEKHLPFLTEVDDYRFRKPSESADLSNFSNSRPNIETIKIRLSRSPCISHAEWSGICRKPLSSNSPTEPKRKSRAAEPTRILPIFRAPSEWKMQRYNTQVRISKCPLVKSSNICPGMEGNPTQMPEATDISRKSVESKPLQIPDLGGNPCCHLRGLKCQNFKNYKMKMEESRACALENMKK